MDAIIHGAYGNPKEHWLPWLWRQFEGKGRDVIVPCFPTPDGQTLANWKTVFSEYEDDLTEESILVGHSLGCAFLLDVLERRKVKAVFFVSGFLRLLDNPQFDSINKTFVDRTFDFDRITKNCDRFIVLHGEDDPYVPLDYGRELSLKVGGEFVVVPRGGHLNAVLGTEFPVLWEKIEEVL